MRYISYTCPVCCASMLETDAMEQERLSEIERLQEAVTFLVAALKKVQTRPCIESAFIAAVNLEHAHKVYGVDIKASNALGEGRERGILREASSGEAATSTDGLEGGNGELK